MPDRHRTRRRVRVLTAVPVVALGALLWPAPQPALPAAPTGARPFVWNRDTLWVALEASFTQARAAGCPKDRIASGGFASVDSMLVRLRTERVAATEPLLDSLESAFFHLAPGVAACGTRAGEYVALQERFREAIKWSRRHGTTSSASSRPRSFAESRRPLLRPPRLGEDFLA